MFQINFDEIKLTEIVERAVQDALAAKEATQKTEHRILYSIRELAEFLGCSTVTAQKYKNQGWIPYRQIGRKVMFDTSQIINELEKKKGQRHGK
jgi:hypothetical protein